MTPRLPSDLCRLGIWVPETFQTPGLGLRALILFPARCHKQELHQNSLWIERTENLYGRILASS